MFNEVLSFSFLPRASQSFGFDMEQKIFVRDLEEHEAKRRGRAVKNHVLQGGVYSHTVVEPSEELRLQACILMRRLMEGALQASESLSLIAPYYHDAVMFGQICMVGWEIRHTRRRARHGWLARASRVCEARSCSSLMPPCVCACVCV